MNATPPTAGIRADQVLPRALRGDDLQVGEGFRIDLIALPVIPMEMGVDDLADRLLA